MCITDTKQVYRDGVKSLKVPYVLCVSNLFLFFVHANKTCPNYFHHSVLWCWVVLDISLKARPHQTFDCFHTLIAFRACIGALQYVFQSGRVINRCRTAIDLHYCSNFATTTPPSAFSLLTLPPLFRKTGLVTRADRWTKKKPPLDEAVAAQTVAKPARQGSFWHSNGKQQRCRVRGCLFAFTCSIRRAIRFGGKEGDTCFDFRPPNRHTVTHARTHFCGKGWRLTTPKPEANKTSVYAWAALT